MRVADYIIDFIYKKGVGHIFTLAGGGAMFLNDAVACHKKIKYICHHHEQAAAMAAEAYAKTTGNIGAVMITSGPGSTNAITGLLGAWGDSIPCIFLSSQTKRSQMIQFSSVRSLRQFGIQEVDIIPIVRSLTKYAIVVEKPEDIRYHLEKAYFLAKSGRPGPVWLDIPSDVAGSSIDPKTFIGFDNDDYDASNPKASYEDIVKVISFLTNAKKPLIIAGGGIRLSDAVNQFRKLVKTLKIPVVVPDMGLDLLEFNNPYYVGHAGTKGQRAANIVIQNADLILSIGSRLAVPFTGHEYDKFAPHAQKIVVDIDPEEHKKKTIKIDLLITSDARLFIEALRKGLKKRKLNFNKDWPGKCRQLKYRYPSCLQEYRKMERTVNMYYAIDRISEYSNEGDIFTVDAGATAYATSQALRLKKYQRMIIPGCTLTMGYNLPAVIGIWAAKPSSRIICITGDGSFQLNIHELQTISHHRIPAKIFITNNRGYLAIRQTQRNFFSGRFIGEGLRSGVSFPDTEKIAKAYGIKFFRIENNRQLNQTIKKVFNYKGPVICEIICPKWQDILTVSSKKLPNGQMTSLPIDDMYPFMSAEEMEEIRKDFS